MIKKIISILIVILVVFSAVMLLKKRKARMAEAKPPAVKPIVVESFTLKKDNVLLTLPYIATVKSDAGAEINTKIAGRIEKLPVQTGERVKKGDLLVKIDDDELKSKINGLQKEKQSLKWEIQSVKSVLRAKRTNLENLKKKHARTAELLKVDGASIEEYESEETSIAALKSEIEIQKNKINTLQDKIKILESKISEIKASLKYTKIYSPVSGTVSEKYASEGENIIAGKKILKITGKDKKYLEIQLPQDKTAKTIKTNGEFYNIKGLNDTDASGTLRYKTSYIKKLKASTGEILPVEIVTYRGNNKLLPYNAVLDKDNDKFVFVYSNGDVQARRIDVAHSGIQGIVADNLSGVKRVITAKPDILLRVLSGVPVKVLSDKQ
ncbi:efflux transporter, RND family, MFP subunit [Flexistipes sinusarabici DSM 4947]|uniref:Efflux transporter, RND family, MFP subunit n=1 Tax=Flexistipes sinusarabici (strain ATCC 49648 / DSM 4947 / MAS 10) TaxID=717231 RepID=F8E7C8_FLESM|nr:efflux RND transporter periplasmic adaptor subunit [Flexistipes sinusarabici]AEI13843.1 efflux transporter, RND family, MFP subunit [Flexistipes sinusarabici DSM 4947]